MPNNVPPPTRKWTVMVYMSGQNRLFDEMIYALKDMKRVAPPNNEDVALLAEFSAKWVSRKDLSNTRLATPRRFDLITNKDYPAGSVARNFKDVEQGEPYPTLIEELAQFIWWGVKNYPAQHYMVVFSGDGGGVNSDFLPSLLKPGRKIRAYDLTELFDQVNRLAKEDKEKEDAAKKIPKAERKKPKKIVFDIVGFDSCMMSMVEIGHGLRTRAKYIIGSQGNEDDMGWPFGDILKPLVTNPQMTPVELARTAVDKYNTYYLDYALIAGASACLSAFRVDKMSDVFEEVKGFVNVVLPLLPRDPKKQTEFQQIFIGLLVHAHWVAQTYRQDQFADLYDFCDRFILEAEVMMKTHQLSKLKPVVAACKRIKDVICKTPECDKDDGSAVINSCSVGPKYQYARGLSIYFPWNKIEQHYYPGDEFETPAIRPDYFGDKTGWSIFLQRFIQCSQRPARQWPKPVVPPDVGRILEKLGKDPPEGKGFLGLDPEPAKNPPTEWNISPCVMEPLRLNAE